MRGPPRFVAGRPLVELECRRPPEPRVAVVYPGVKRYPLAEDVEVVPPSALAGGWDPFEPGPAPEEEQR